MYSVATSSVLASLTRKIKAGSQLCTICSSEPVESGDRPSCGERNLSDTTGNSAARICWSGPLREAALLTLRINANSAPIAVTRDRCEEQVSGRDENITSKDQFRDRNTAYPPAVAGGQA